MATPFDRAAKSYIEEWVPRFVPYHLDLVRELSLAQGQRVLIARCGPGAEVLAVARAVGDLGKVRATDPSAELIGICKEQVDKAGFPSVTCERAAPDDVGEGNWNAIVCAFGLWTMEDRPAVLRTWASALAPNGKVGALSFGPPDDNDPFEILARALRELEPDAVTKPPRIDSDRDSFARVFEEGGLAIVRHTILRHTVSFATAEDFTNAIREGRTWRSVWAELGPERMGRVTARFYEQVGGPTAPLVFEPAATLAIAALPGAEVELAVRPSVVAPRLPSGPPSQSMPVSERRERREPWDDEKPKS
jgi:ubiquinone/menaquinone biosynthesis C-methylase UbiE